MTAPLIYLTGNPVAANAFANFGDVENMGNMLARLRHAARNHADELGATLTGTLWERLGGSKGPVNPSRVFAVGEVSKQPGNRGRFIYGRTDAGEFESRTRRPDEIRLNYYPTVEVFTYTR